MRYRYFKTILCSIISLAGLCLPVLSNSSDTNNMIRMTTSHGVIEIEVYPEEAPISAANFLSYVEKGFYDGTIFHRVIPGFMLQGGGFTADMQQKKTDPPIVNEADNGLKNTLGMLSMARTQDPNSATSQFFINVVDNAFLDFTAKTPQGWGYAVFAKVTSGMDVVQKIAQVKTGSVGGHGDVPVEPIVVEKAEIIAE